MDKTLKRLFDFQKFEQNEDLQQIINSVHARYGVRELSLDDLSQVNAAGDPALMAQNKEKENAHR